MKVTDNKTQWAKIGKISRVSFVGKDILFYGAGCHLIFINLSTFEELIYTANSTRNGDGISCFMGCRTQNVFAFAEKKTNAAVFIKTYPKFEDVSVLKDDEETGYSNACFSERSMLVCVGELPAFNVSVWNWRTGEKLAKHDGGIWMHNQLLKCCLGSPVILAQLGVNTDILHIWDIYICSKQCILTQHVAKIKEKTNFVSVLWTSEGGLFVLDTQGCIYMTMPDHRLEKVVDFQNVGSYQTSCVWYKMGIAVYGPNNEIRHYKKSGSWDIDWSMIPPEPILKLESRFDHLIAITETFNIMEVHPLTQSFTYVKNAESNFIDFCLIQPTAQYFLASTQQGFALSYRVETGELLDSLEIGTKALTMAENPKFPYVAVGFDNGIVKLVSVYNPQKIAKMTQFHLCKEAINCIRFNDCGTIFVAANLITGRLFIIEGLPGGEMKIVTTIDTKTQFADFMMVASNDCYRIFLIPVTSKTSICGNVIQRYCVRNLKKIDIREYNFTNSNLHFCGIVPSVGLNRDRIFYLMPYDGKKIHEVEIRRGQIEATILRKIPTGHQMRGIRLQLGKKTCLTCGFDGFVISRCSNFERQVGIYLPHHRMEGGVKKARIETHEKYIISLGRDGVLVCTNLLNNEIDTGLQKSLERIHNSEDNQLLFSKRTIGFIPRGKYEGKCYLEVEEMRKVEEEKKRCHAERESILKEFKSIKKHLQDLLTENLQGPENEKLDLKEFDLNPKLFEAKTLKHISVKKATEVYLKKLIDEHNKISDYMMTMFWKKMSVHGTVIKSIFANFEVANYVLLPQTYNRDEVMKLITYARELERYLNGDDVFYPWLPMEEGKLLELTSQKPELPKKEKRFTIASLEETMEEVVEDPETVIAMSGSDTARFVEMEIAHYHQSELQTYFQMELQWIIAKTDCHKLKEYFNSHFDKMMLQKMKEMSSIKQRNDRLRHIVSELNYFSEEKISVTIDDPEWSSLETPDAIIQVKNEEVPITPYISPSEQAILDAKAAEAERIRLLLLADDFRERALMAMMNGVLEVRWEDELKKDVPVPKCMLEKNPENFNEEDLRNVKDYEEKVQFLISERERYKTLLRAEYEKIAHLAKDNIRKFNGKLEELVNKKLQIDSCLSQESLKIIRMKFFLQERMGLVKKEQVIEQKIAENEEIVSSLQKLISTLQESVNECRNNIESFQIKEKFLERSYRKDFQDMQVVVQEQVSKLYKKRPKINFRMISSGTLLDELARSLAPNSKISPILNTDCLEFLKQMENLDQYFGVPSLVDERTFALLCKHRRMRVEYEIRLKASQNELTEAETTLQNLQKRLNQKKELTAKLHNDLTELRQEVITHSGDIRVQIVMPRGLVEIPLCGSMSDFDNTVLIRRQDVEDINKIILGIGEKKIKVLERSTNFRRRIMILEWEHKRKKMLIQDLQEKLIDIGGVRVTKEIQSYLKSKNKEKSMPFETEVDMIKGSYENTIQDRKDKVNKMRKQMRAIKANDKVVEEKIKELNIDVCEYNTLRDHEFDAKERKILDARMKGLLKRSKLIQDIQNNHHEILVLQTELELLRLKTFPTLKYKVF